MFKRGRLIRDLFASIGGLLAIAGIALLPMQYLVWRKTDVWPAMQIRTIFDLMSIATPQGVDAVLNVPLSIAMLAVGLVFMWIAIEIYEPLGSRVDHDETVGREFSGPRRGAKRRSGI